MSRIWDEEQLTACRASGITSSSGTETDCLKPRADGLTYTWPGFQSYRLLGFFITVASIAPFESSTISSATLAQFIADEELRIAQGCGVRRRARGPRETGPFCRRRSSSQPGRIDGLNDRWWRPPATLPDAQPQPDIRISSQETA
ncbi:MAG: hypothetical protein IPI73_26460 [Betaproteobacteria bacterium]|nr:hypothetical protein [Betaproteobacteria bacterium]